MIHIKMCNEHMMCTVLVGTGGYTTEENRVLVKPPFRWE